MIYVDFSYYGDDNSRLASLHKAWPPQNLASKVGYRGEACQPHHLRQILLVTVVISCLCFFVIVHTTCIWFALIRVIQFGQAWNLFAFFFFFEQKIKENPTRNVSWSLSYDQLGANTDLPIKQKKKKMEKKLKINWQIGSLLVDKKKVFRPYA